jgi:hypothetical protein
MNALALVLQDPRGEKPLALSSRWSHLALLILTQTSRSSLCEGSAKELSYLRQILFSWPSDPSNFLSRLATSTGYLLLWAFLVPTTLSPRLRGGMMVPPLLCVDFDIWSLLVVQLWLWTIIGIMWNWWLCKLWCCGSILVILGFYAKTKYSSYAWPRINCYTHMTQKCSQITKCHE